MRMHQKAVILQTAICTDILLHHVYVPEGDEECTDDGWHCKDYQQSEREGPNHFIIYDIPALCVFVQVSEGKSQYLKAPAIHKSSLPFV